jgi:hypothetical protein
VLLLADFQTHKQIPMYTRTVLVGWNHLESSSPKAFNDNTFEDNVYGNEYIIYLQMQYINIIVACADTRIQRLYPKI